MLGYLLYERKPVSDTPVVSKEMHRKDYLSDGKTIWISEWIYMICNKIITIILNENVMMSKI